jgi:hypothetical protein
MATFLFINKNSRDKNHTMHLGKGGVGEGTLRIGKFMKRYCESSREDE